MTNRFKDVFRLGVLLLAAATAHAADPYPTRPVTLVVPQAAGGTNDIIGRLAAAGLTQQFGESFIVDNRPGAGGNIGTQHAARSKPDGYTLLLTVSSSQAINPALYAKVPFDPVADFEPISLIASVPNVLVVNPSVPVKTIRELLANAKAKPGDYRFASSGNGTLPHLLGEMLSSMGGLKLEHVPYKGIAPALTDVIGNHVPMAFASLPSVLPHIRAGTVRAIGISSAARSPIAPDIPAIAETLPGFTGDLWVGLFAVKGTPLAVTQALGQAMNKALADKELRGKMVAQGADVIASTPAQLQKALADDLVKWGKIVKDTGATLD
ncbi:MAG: tripartite tricarboxylate transporter substrate binding protein [Polaromonas sp.]|nr:tripartite tricarboxylate transporter substrate binding protein [Polaromonas sp.]